MLKNNTFTRYKKRVVGEKGMLYYLWFELLIFLFKDFPGSLGIILRKLFYRTLFKSVGCDVFVEQGVTIRCPNRIIIDDGVFVEHSSSLISCGQKGAGIHIKEGSSIGIANIIYAYTDESYIEIGKNCRFAHSVQILSHGKVKIGNDVLMGSFSYITSSSHIVNKLDLPISKQGFETKDVIIQDDVWIGAHVTILEGVKIGRGSVIGAGSVVNKDIPEYSIAVGVPARVIKKRGE
jgi:acetyltransferase-like isoleucine patch superfamily enzyme